MAPSHRMPEDKTKIVLSLYILLWVPLKRAFAGLSAKIIRFTLIDECCRCVFLVHIHSAHWIFGHRELPPDYGFVLTVFRVIKTNPIQRHTLACPAPVCVTSPQFEGLLVRRIRDITRRS